MKILVLGHKGMLGHMVVGFLKKYYNVSTISTRWPECKEKILSFKGDYIINCIGAIPQRTNNFDINWQLPTWLDENVDCKIIHPGTDCEENNDYYGVSKLNASDYIKIEGNRTKIIKTSIIGHELDSSNSLLDWFLNSEGSVSGYTRAYWNGNTTLEWSLFCEDLMLKWEKYEVENVINTDCISKYQLLKKISKVYDKKITILKNDSVVANKCLNGDFRESIDIQLRDLKEFYKK